MFDKETKYYSVLPFVGNLEKFFFFFFLLDSRKIFPKNSNYQGCVRVCVCMCFNRSTILCWHRYCAILLESMLLVMGSQCSLILILELWLYSIWFPRVSVIRSITDLKCHPGSGICCQAVYAFRNTNISSPHPPSEIHLHMGPTPFQEHLLTTL